VIGEPHPEILTCRWCERTSEEEIWTQDGDAWQETCGPWSGYEEIMLCPSCYATLMRQLEV
jgi:hypothetical protein